MVIPLLEDCSYIAVAPSITQAIGAAKYCKDAALRVIRQVLPRCLPVPKHDVMHLPHKACIQAGIYAKVATGRPAGLLLSGLCESAQSASRLM